MSVTVPVALGERSYPVLVGPTARLELEDLVHRLPTPPEQVAVVTQDPVRETGWFAQVDPGVPFDVQVIPDGEGAKALETVEGLCRAFARQGLSRRDLVVAVGGGVVSDVAGFAAAVYLRGVSYVTVATTLLAQVDAAIGGKTGVNLPEGKNLVGAFWQPAAVLCDTDTLATLSPREMGCGRGEMAKYAFLTGNRPDLSLLELPLAEQVARCVAIKAQAVAHDEREAGRRALLNYGHTLAHALEAALLEPGGPSGDLRHGEAVAVGLMFAARLARRLGRIDDQRVDQHRQVVEGFGLSIDLPTGVRPDRLVWFMQRDKKAHHDLTFVLDGPVGVEVVSGVEPAEVLATLGEMGEGR